MTEIGTRVWAVRAADDRQVAAYGFGTYIGDRLMDGWDHPAALGRAAAAIRRGDDGPRWFNPEAFYQSKVDAGEMTAEQAAEALAEGARREAAERARPMVDRVTDLAKAMGMNPVIALDAGGWVWGAECWWGEADDDTPTSWAKGRAIVTVPAPNRGDPPSHDA